jgi:hypothetical protein
MPQYLTLTPKQRFAAATQLGAVLWRENIQGTSQRRLLREALPAPSPSQGQVGTKPRVDLGDGSTTSQNAGQDVHHLGHGRMVNFLDR